MLAGRCILLILSRKCKRHCDHFTRDAVFWVQDSLLCAPPRNLVLYATTAVFLTISGEWQGALFRKSAMSSFVWSTFLCFSLHNSLTNFHKQLDPVIYSKCYVKMSKLLGRILYYLLLRRRLLVFFVLAQRSLLAGIGYFAFKMHFS